jgi:hypothetical protein
LKERKRGKPSPLRFRREERIAPTLSETKRANGKKGRRGRKQARKRVSSKREEGGRGEGRERRKKEEKRWQVHGKGDR